MASLTLPPQRIKLLKIVERSFKNAGWKVIHRPDNSLDFRIDSGNLVFFIKCLDETRINYESTTSILGGLERHARGLRSFGNRQLIVVLDRNFLLVDLAHLLDRGIFVLTIAEIEILTSLSAISECTPGTLSKRQVYLLERSCDYALFVSKLHYEEHDLAAAIEWGRHAVQHSVGNRAYFWLFKLLRDAGELDAAAELGEKIRLFRRDDRRLLLGMEELARKRGNLAEAAEWHARLGQQPTTPRTLEDILAKQRMQREAASSSGGAAPAPEARPAERGGLTRLFRALRRSSTD